MNILPCKCLLTSNFNKRTRILTSAVNKCLMVNTQLAVFITGVCTEFVALLQLKPGLSKSMLLGAFVLRIPQINA